MSSSWKGNLISRSALAAGLIFAGLPGAGPATADSAVPAAYSVSGTEAASHCREIPMHPPIRPGDSGPVVAHAQCLLKYHWNQNIVVNGIFDQSTRLAVRNVHVLCGEIYDGIFGPRVWKLLHQTSC
jgi:zinc D-Ala-D-Ala carboxypeptidase